METEDVFNGVGVRIRLIEDFLMIKETLQRIGVASYKTQTLYQSCHILHKKEQYAILHFKEMFKLDGRNTSLDEGDIGRRNMIVKMLENWKLVEVLDKKKIESPLAEAFTIKVLPHSARKSWNLEAKYSIGNPNNKRYLHNQL